MLQPFVLLMWSFPSCSCYRLWLLPASVSTFHVSFPLCAFSCNFEGQPLVLSLMRSIKAFNSWRAIILLLQQHVSIRCNYIVKHLGRHEGLQDLISPLCIQLQGGRRAAAASTLCPSRQRESDLGQPADRSAFDSHKSVLWHDLKWFDACSFSSLAGIEQEGNAPFNWSMKTVGV